MTLRQRLAALVAAVAMVMIAMSTPSVAPATAAGCVPPLDSMRVPAPDCDAPKGTVNPNWRHESMGSTVRIHWWPDFHWTESAPGGDVRLNLYVDEWVVARQTGVVNSVSGIWFHSWYYDVPTEVPYGAQTDIDPTHARYDCPLVNGNLFVELVMRGYVEYSNGERFTLEPMRHPCVDP